jgi:hypothetical protein
MSELDEQRVVDALRAYTGGLTVTDQEIITAESRLRDRLEPPSHRRRLVILAAAVAAVLLVGFFVSQAFDWNQESAPPADTPSSPADTLKDALQADAYDVGTAHSFAGVQPTAQDMAGFWMLRLPFSSVMLVDADGDWLMGAPTHPAVFGTSTLAGETWTRRHDERSQCNDNAVRGLFQAWRAALAPDGSLRLEQTGGNPTCTPADNFEVWDRLVPGAPVADYLLAVTQDVAWQAAPVSFRWQGLYVAPATGHVLDVADDGTYRYHDTLTESSLVAADHGELGIDNAGSAGSCVGGSFTGNAEVAQLPGVTGYVGSYDAVRVTTTTNNCASGVAEEDVWVKVFNY